LLLIDADAAYFAAAMLMLLLITISPLFRYRC